MAHPESYNKDATDTAQQAIGTSANASKRRKHTAAHGNFSDYYQVRGSGAGSSTRQQRDPRVHLLLRTLESQHPPVRILDIGCNQGRVGIELASSLSTRETQLIGVDIDQALISQARTAAQHAGIASQSRFFALDWMHAEDEQFAAEKEQGFDFVLALSITKWIHIHDSDTGLVRFFTSIIEVLRPGGLLFLEPQPDKSYEQARRELSPELRSRARRLRLRMLDFEFVLEVLLGLERVQLLGGTESATHSRIDWPDEDDTATTHHYLPFPWVSRDPKQTRQAAAVTTDQSEAHVNAIDNPLFLKPRSVKRKK